MFRSSKITDRNDWVELWEADVKSVLATMFRNLADDLTCGYDPCGLSIQRERAEINAYSDWIDKCFETFKTMTQDEQKNWCFWDLKKRGAIS